MVRCRSAGWLIAMAFTAAASGVAAHPARAPEVVRQAVIERLASVRAEFMEPDAATHRPHARIRT